MKTRFKKDLKFSVLKLSEAEKNILQEKSVQLGISMTQLITYGALRASQLNIPKKEHLDASIQIRLTVPIHKKLEEMSQELGRPMTELILLGLRDFLNLGEL